MMKKNFYYILCVSTLAIFIIFFLQEKTRIFKLKTLGGVTNKTEFPHITFKNYTDGSLQKKLEQYSKENFGFREWAIRLYNQYLWTCYNKTSVRGVLFGKDNYLYEPWFVKDYYGNTMYDYTENANELLQKFDNESNRLYKIQEILKEYNVSLFVACLPGKERIYPEYLPENKLFNRPSAPKAIEYYPKYFDSIGLNNINICSWFEEWKKTAEFPLFPQTGTHWSNIAATYVSDSIIRYAESISNLNINNIEINNIHPSKTIKPDNDLENLMNLMFPLKKMQNYYADVSIIPDSSAVKPNMIVIGDSFFWNIYYVLPLKKIFENCFYWYYNNTIYFDDNHKSTKEINLAEQLINSDIVMLSYSTVQLYKMSNDFSAHALVNLCYDDEQIESAMNNIINCIKNDAHWYGNIQEKAKKEGKTIEEMLRTDAQYIIYSEPEKYFPELNGNSVPQSRNKNLKVYYEERHGIALKETAIKNIKERMLKTPEWIENLKKKAKDSGISLEEIMENDALWIYGQENK